MRLANVSIRRASAGLALLILAYLLIVGSGMDIDAEHDRSHRWVILIAALMACSGVLLLSCSRKRSSLEK